MLGLVTASLSCSEEGSVHLSIRCSAPGDSVAPQPGAEPSDTTRIDSSDAAQGPNAVASGEMSWLDLLKKIDLLKKDDQRLKRVARALLPHLRESPCAQDGMKRWQAFISSHLDGKRNARDHGRDGVLAAQPLGFDFVAMRVARVQDEQGRAGPRAVQADSVCSTVCEPTLSPYQRSESILPIYLKRGQGPASFQHTVTDSPGSNMSEGGLRGESDVGSCWEMSQPSRRSRDVPSWSLMGEKVTPPVKEVNRVRGLIQRDLKKGRKEAELLEEVFNPDHHRSQLPLDSEDLLLQPLLHALEKAGHLRLHDLGRSVALYSSPGCQMQPWHADFDPRVRAVRKRKNESVDEQLRREEQASYRCIREMKDSEKPLGVFWAVEEGCKLMVVGPEGEAVEVHLEKGEVLIFQGDLVHAGAAYPEGGSMRVHVYLHARGVAKPNGNTYRVEDFVPKCHVQWNSSMRSGVL